MEKRRGTFIYIFGPPAVFLLVSMAVSLCMEILWVSFLQERAIEGADPVYSYAAQSLWGCLRMVIPAGAGCFAVRRDAGRELALFCVTEIPERRPFPRKAYPILMTAAAALSLGINLLAVVMVGGVNAAVSLPGALPGLSGFVVQTALYVITMPFMEELLFRGILFPRIHRIFGIKPAVLLSAAVFGLYHGSPAQAVYAFLMGLVFAAAYERTRRFTVPYALHGTCNLLVLILQWTDTYGRICTVSWALAFLGIAAGGFAAVYVCQREAGQ